MPSFVPLKLLVISNGYMGNLVKNPTNMKNDSIYYVKKYYSSVMKMDA
jgi:hypothetical protein